ncbi:hypothetical protein MMPV_001580 [Pyropia vietnamensis]
MGMAPRRGRHWSPPPPSTTTTVVTPSLIGTNNLTTKQAPLPFGGDEDAATVAAAAAIITSDGGLADLSISPVSSATPSVGSASPVAAAPDTPPPPPPVALLPPSASGGSPKRSRPPPPPPPLSPPPPPTGEALVGVPPRVGLPPLPPLSLGGVGRSPLPLHLTRDAADYLFAVAADRLTGRTDEALGRLVAAAMAAAAAREEWGGGGWGALYPPRQPLPAATVDPDGYGMDPHVLLPVRLREVEVRWLLDAGGGAWEGGRVLATLLDGVRRRGDEAAVFGARD